MPKKKIELEQWHVDLAQRLKALRDKNGFTQKDISEDDSVQITLESYHAYESAGRDVTKGNNITGMSITTFRALCDKLHTTPDYLLGYTDVSSTNGSIRQASETTGLSEEAIERLRSFDIYEQHLVSRMIQTDAFKKLIQSFTEIESIMYPCLNDFLFEVAAAKPEFIQYDEKSNTYDIRDPKLINFWKSSTISETKGRRYELTEDVIAIANQMFDLDNYIANFSKEIDEYVKSSEEKPSV